MKQNDNQVLEAWLIDDKSGYKLSLGPLVPLDNSNVYWLDIGTQ